MGDDDDDRRTDAGCLPILQAHQLIKPNLKCFSTMYKNKKGRSFDMTTCI